VSDRLNIAELANHSEAQRQAQLDREKSSRQAASGKRASAILRGDLGPVLKRWVSGSVLPVSTRLRCLVGALQGGDLKGAATLAASPVFGLPALAHSRDIEAVYAWALKGDHAEDLVLAVLGTAISLCATAKDPSSGVPLTRVLMVSGQAARETALGQFLTQVQGAKTMMRVRGKGTPAWAQGKKLDAIAALMTGQVRSALEASSEEIPVGGKAVVKIITQAGDERRIELRKPEAADWALLDVARHVKGERDGNLETWVSFAMLVLCCAQAEAGWFDLVKIRRARSKKHRRAAHGLILCDAAWGALRGDLDRWLSLGFISEPMVTEPTEGDYLSVKHRPVAGGRGPMGMKTDAKGTAAWHVASEVMAKTAWSVAEQTLEAIKDGPLKELAAVAEPDEARRELILGGFSRVAAKPFYMPLFLDFRGRVYTRPNLVTYQGRDLQKSLCVFPEGPAAERTGPALQAIALHISALFGGPDKLDKASIREREDWWFRVVAGQKVNLNVIAQADEPLQLYTAWSLLHAGQWDRIPCQIDGTCNGLQHLSALFRDETAAPFVNLVGGMDRPADIYAEVAARVSDRLRALGDDPGNAWARRLLAAVKLDRKLCKKPVMVLPYGGTRSTIEEAVLEAILEQEPDPRYWTDGDPRHEPGSPPLYVDWVRGGYDAFRKRDLRDHPLLHLDAKRLGGVVWEAIVEILPKAMAAMQAFRDIAKAVGSRSLEWSTGFECDGRPPLWVVQAKARSDKTGLKFKGLHLPNSVRGLRIRPGRDEVDPGAHTSGIVANFIHSQDAAHLARTMDWIDSGYPSFGAIHDCYITRPSLMGNLGDAARKAFKAHYEADPLAQPVRLRRSGDLVDEFPSWYALAQHFGVSFPERGSWEPSEVVSSQWFFS
jgi:hypothetical protein